MISAVKDNNFYYKYMYICVIKIVIFTKILAGIAFNVTKPFVKFVFVAHLHASRHSLFILLYQQPK